MGVIKLWTCLILTMSILPVKSSTITSPSPSSAISSPSTSIAASASTSTLRSTSTSKLIPKNLTSLAITSEEALTSSHLLLLTHSDSDDEGEDGDNQSFLDPSRPEAGRWVDGWSVWDMKDWKRLYRVWKGERVVEVVVCEVEGLVVLATEVKDMFTPYQHISVFRFGFLQLDPNPGTNTWEALVHPDAALPYIELAVPQVHETHTIVITPGPDGRIMIQIVPMPDYRHNYVAVFDWKAGVCLGLVWSPDEPGLSYSFDFLTSDIIIAATSHDIADSSASATSLEALTLDEEPEAAPEYLALRFFKLLDYAESMDPMERLVLSPPGTPVAGWRLDEVYLATPLSALLFPPLRRGRSTWHGGWEAWYEITSFTLNGPSTYDGRGVLSFVLGGSHEVPAFDGLEENLTHALGAIDIGLLSGFLNEGRLVQWDEWRHAVHLMTSKGAFTAAHDSRTVEVIEEETMQDDTSKWLITIRDYSKASSTPAAFVIQHAEVQVQPLIELEAINIQEDSLTSPVLSFLRQLSPPSRSAASIAIPPQRHMFSAGEIHAHLDHVAASFELDVSARDELRWVLYDGDRIILSFPDSVKIISF